MIGVASWRWERSTPTELMMAGRATTTTYVSAAPRRTPAPAKPSDSRAPRGGRPAASATSAGRGRDRHVLAVLVKNDGERARVCPVEEGTDQCHTAKLVRGGVESDGGLHRL